LKISILMPVYNAAEFVRQAVESALAQPETGEVILAEDASTDASLEVCRKLEAQYPAVHLYRHPDGKRHGASASRNLAIAKSTCEFVAFLDADDLYLPERFRAEGELFRSDADIDGVYGALGRSIENEAAEERWRLAHSKVEGMTTMDISVPSEQLFEVLVSGKHGHFHLDCTTVKRAVFDKVGPFNAKLCLGEDTELFWRMAALVKLAPGSLDQPVAVRRIHDHNSISAPRSPAELYWLTMLCLREAWHWAGGHLPIQKQQVMLRRYLMYSETTRLKTASGSRSLKFQRKIWLLAALLRDPVLIVESHFWQRLLPRRLFPAESAVEKIIERN
jgi:glycosyltransferase involved in cell wall biosynthesis